MGYGLDFDEQYRNLPYIAVLEARGLTWPPADSVSSAKSDARPDRAGLDRGAREGRTRHAARVGHASRAAGDGGAGRAPSIAALPADLAPVAASDARRHRCRPHRARAEGRARRSPAEAGKAVTDPGTVHGRSSGLSGHRRQRSASAVVRREADAGIVIDGAGLGSAIAANKIRGVRAAMCTTPTLARYAREHNGANVLALGATLLQPAEANEIVDVWLSTPTREAALPAAAAEDSPRWRSRSDGRALRRSRAPHCRSWPKRSWRRRARPVTRVRLPCRGRGLLSRRGCRRSSTPARRGWATTPRVAPRAAWPD